MKPISPGFRVAVVGASSLLGQELISILGERRFPVSRLVKFETEVEEPELPVIDLEPGIEASELAGDLSGTAFDYIFIAMAPPSAAAGDDLLRRASEGNCAVIDLISMSTQTGASLSAEGPMHTLRVPLFERAGLALADAPGTSPAGKSVFVSAHPSAIVISSLLLRLASQCRLKSAAAHIFMPASELGSRAVDELQKQTVNLLSFQKPQQKIFGAQLAFSVLPRLGRTRTSPLAEIEKRIRFQLRQFLTGRAPLPALRLVLVPVFYSLTFSLFVETTEPASVEALTHALEGEHIQMRKAFQSAPSSVEVAGSNEILIDAITRDAESSTGFWIWATADNMRLSALNAVEIAESLQETRSPARLQ